MTSKLEATRKPRIFFTHFFDLKFLGIWFDFKGQLTQEEFDNITDKSMFRDNFQFKHSKSSQQLWNGCDSHLTQF